MNVRPLLVSIAIVAAAASSAAEPAWHWPASSRTVVVGDVHGAYTELVGLLKETGLVDDSLHWTGEDATLVSLGDLIDRGPASRKVLDLMMQLEDEAPMHGGAVRVVLGNHEVMNLTGDLRYVSAEQYAEFAADETPAQRQAAYARFLARRPQSADDSGAKDAFAQRYPPGYFARQRAFRPDGRYGRWLLSLPALIVVGDTAFVHGGLSAEFARMPGAELNRRVSESLTRYLSVRSRLADAGVLPEADMGQDPVLARAAQKRYADEPDTTLGALLDEFVGLSEAPVLGADGPLWYRGAVMCQPILARPALDTALAQLGIARIVVGHTPTDDRQVHALYDGKLLMLDTGMLRQYYGGRPAALVIEKGHTTVRYLDSPAPSAPLQGAVAAYGLDEAQLSAALGQGSVELQHGESAESAVVDYGGKALEAVIYRGREAELELAAYGLDHLLGFDLVPPTIARDVDGRSGALQLRYPNEISESQRVERKLPFGEGCPMPAQFQLMYTFDVLTHNTGRSRDNILYRRGLSDLKLTGHSRTFDTQRRLPRLEQGVLMPPPAAIDALESLTEAELDTALGSWLDRRRIRALLARRDAFVARVAGDGASESR
jgi:hypothetical protein